MTGARLGPARGTTYRRARGPAVLVHPGLHHYAHGLSVRVGLELLHLSHDQDALQQVVDTRSLFG